MDQPRRHWRSTLYVILHSWVLKLFGRQFLHFFHQRESKIINLPPFCARPLIYRLNLGSKPTIKCVNHLHSSVLKTTIHTWPQVGSSWLLAPVLSSSLYHGHDIQCTSKYRTVGTSENLMGQVHTHKNSFEGEVFFSILTKIYGWGPIDPPVWSPVQTALKSSITWVSRYTMIFRPVKNGWQWAISLFFIRWVTEREE